MANGSDGSIIIDTELDNDGFEKGSDKLLKAVQDLAGAVDNLGDNMMGSFSRIIPLLQTIAGSATNVNSTISDTATQAADAGERAAQAERDVAGAARQAQQAADQQGQSMSGMASEASTAQTNAAALSREIEGLSNGMSSLSRSAETGFANANAVLTFDNKLTDMQAKLDAARGKLEAFAQVQIPTDDYIWLQNEIQKVEKEYDRLLERQDKMEATGVKHNTKAWEALEYQIARNREMVAEYRAEMSYLETSGGAFTTGAQTKEYAQMAEQLQQIEAEIQRNGALIDQEALAQARLNVQTAQEAVLVAQTAEEREAAMERLRAAQGELRDLAASMSNKGTEAPPEEDVSGWQRFASVLRSAGSAAVNLASNLARVSFRAMSNGVKSLTNKLRQFRSQSHNTNLTANSLVKTLTSLKRMLITRIKRMFISSIFNGIKEAMRSLALFDSAFNTAMSNIKNSAKQMGANLSVSLGRLVAAIEPVLTRIVNLISTAISYLNALFALLGGHSTITVAKKQTADYASSLEAAGGAAENLKKQVYGFDELNKRSSDSGGGGGGGGGDLFEEVPIDDMLPDAVKDFFDRIKQAFEDGDWYGIGTVIAEGFNYALDVVDNWINNTARPWLEKWAGRVADVLNGITDGLDWKKIGKTVADGFNTVFSTVNTFLKKFNAKKFGRGIGQAVKSWFDKIDWRLVGETFANKWNTLLHLIEGLVTTPGIWESIGKSVGQFIKSWFSNIDIDSLATSVISIINGVVSSIRSFLDQKPFEGVAEKVGGAINRVLHEVNWAELGQTISDLFMEVLTVLWDVVQEIDWEALGEAIGEFLGNIDWLGLLEKVAEIIWTAFTGVLKGLLSTDGGRIFVALLTAIKGLKLVFSLTEGGWMGAVSGWAEKGLNILRGLPAKIDELAPGLVSSLGSMAKAAGTAALGVFDAVMVAYDAKALIDASNTYKEAQNAHNHETETALNSYAKLYKDKGKEVADQWANMVYQIDTTNMTFEQSQEAIAAKIETYWDGVPQSMWEGFEQGWDHYFGENGAGLGSLLEDSFDGAVNGIKDLLGIHSPSTVFEDMGANTVKGFYNGINNSWSQITTFFDQKLTQLKTSLTTKWDGIKTAAATSWGNIKTTVTQKWNDLHTSLSNTQWSGIGSNVVTGLQNGIVNAWGTLKQKFNSMVSGLISGAKSILGVASPSKVFYSIGQFVDEGLTGGLMDGEKHVFAAVKDIATGMTDGMDVGIPEIGTTADDMLDGLDQVATRLTGIANIFRMITDSLTSMNGLRMPQIAAGTVVPVKTKIDPSAVDNPLTGDFTAFSDGVDERMADQTYVLRQILAAINALHLNIDLDALTRAITKQQRERSLNFGGAV